MIKIAVASGKGGTGKTTIATSLMQTAPKGNNLFLDCDVEAPNAHIAIKPDFTSTTPVHKLIPQIDTDRCTYCGKCAQACRYNAISVFNQHSLVQKPNILVFSNLCHSCGVCNEVCPENAITDVENELGILKIGKIKNFGILANGELKSSSALATPLIHALKKEFLQTIWDYVILDSPPGTSCSVVETIKNTDFVILVTEPTPFGYHDLVLAIELVKNMHIPAGIIVNRDGIGNIDMEAISQDTGIPILMRIPMEKRIAQELARGNSLLEAFPEYTPAFEAVHLQINEIVSKGSAS